MAKTKRCNSERGGVKKRKVNTNCLKKDAFILNILRRCL